MAPLLTLFLPPFLMVRNLATILNAEQAAWAITEPNFSLLQLGRLREVK